MNETNMDSIKWHGSPDSIAVDRFPIRIKMCTSKIIHFAKILKKENAKIRLHQSNLNRNPSPTYHYIKTQLPWSNSKQKITKEKEKGKRGLGGSSIYFSVFFKIKINSCSNFAKIAGKARFSFDKTFKGNIKKKKKNHRECLRWRLNFFFPPIIR